MNKNELLSGLTANGYTAELTTVTKNAVTMDAIKATISKEAGVIVYPDTAKNLESVISALANIEIPKYDCLTDAESVLKNIYIGLQRKTETDLVTRNCDFCNEIMQYLYVRIGDGMRACVMPDLLKSLNITTVQAWESAKENTFRTTAVMNLGSMLNAFGCNIDGASDISAYVVTNGSGTYGASAVMDKQTIRERITDVTGCSKFICIPSSIHEVILVPYTADVEYMQSVEKTINDVNASMVDPIERLGDRPFIITV